MRQRQCRGVAVALASSLALAPLPAHGQQATTPAVGASSQQLPRTEVQLERPRAVEQPPLLDIVRLKSGAYFRGTIVEFIPNGSVTLIGADGEHRRFAASDVEYAGKVDAEPPKRESKIQVSPAPSAITTQANASAVI